VFISCHNEQRIPCHLNKPPVLYKRVNFWPFMCYMNLVHYRFTEVCSPPPPPRPTDEMVCNECIKNRQNLFIHRLCDKNIQIANAQWL